MIKLSDHTFRAIDRSDGERSLSMFQRILLGSDGTVTNLLEVILGEDLHVNKISEEVNRASFDIPELEVRAGQKLLRRTVALQGRVSHINYLYANSLIAPDHMDRKFSEALLTTRNPVGKIWDLFQVETYKSLVEWGETVAGDAAACFSVEKSEVCLYRIYRVFSHNRPVMRIAEKFPKKWFVIPEIVSRPIVGDALPVS